MAQVCSTSAPMATQMRSMQARPVALISRSAPVLLPASRRCLAVRAEQQNQGGPKVAEKANTPGDSYTKIEEPVRGPEGNQGPLPNFQIQSEDAYKLDAAMKSRAFNQDKEILGTEVGVADAMRFKGAAPEVINCRLAMVGILAALGAEWRTGVNVFDQFKMAPGPIAGFFGLIIIASLVPILRGQPRYGNKVFSSDAEILNGRVAMLAFAYLVARTYWQTQGIFPGFFS